MGRMVAETISVICSEHSYQHSAPCDMYMFVIKVGHPQEGIVAPPVILYFVQ